MPNQFTVVDRLLTRLSPIQVFIIALCGVAVVGLLDYATGTETSWSLFYLIPVATAAWYVGRIGAIGIALLAAFTWLLADMASGHFYSHPLITLWELFARLGMFLIQGLLLVALRNALTREQNAARTDALTGLTSRHAFEEQLAHDLRLAQRRRSAITLAFLDLDDFKLINDNYGHIEGDRVLRIAGQVLRESTRGADTVARFGGDEFVWLLPDADPQGAEEAVNKIRDDLRQALAFESWKVTFSIGAITFLNAPASNHEALKAADTLMYAAKQRGKDIALFRVAGHNSDKPHPPSAVIKHLHVKP